MFVVARELFLCIPLEAAVAHGSHNQINMDSRIMYYQINFVQYREIATCL